MTLPNDIKQAAQNLGQSLQNTPSVSNYLAADQAVRDNVEVSTLEEKLFSLYQQLAQQERSGQALNQSELNAYYLLKEQVQSNPIITVRDEQLQQVQTIFADAGQRMTSILGIEFSALAL